MNRAEERLGEMEVTLPNLPTRDAPMMSQQNEPELSRRARGIEVWASCRFLRGRFITILTPNRHCSWRWWNAWGSS